MGLNMLCRGDSLAHLALSFTFVGVTGCACVFFGGRGILIHSIL